LRASRIGTRWTSAATDPKVSPIDFTHWRHWWVTDPGSSWALASRIGEGHAGPEGTPGPLAGDSTARTSSWEYANCAFGLGGLDPSAATHGCAVDLLTAGSTKGSHGDAVSLALPRAERPCSPAPSTSAQLGLRPRTDVHQPGRQPVACADVPRSSLGRVGDPDRVGDQPAGPDRAGIGDLRQAKPHLGDTHAHGVEVVDRVGVRTRSRGLAALR
jgi:hypothetical protein